MEYQLKSRQISLFFIAFLPIIKFFTMPCLISEIAGENLWFSVLLNSSVDLITVLLLLSVKTDCDFYTFCENTFGKKFSKIILVLYALFFMLKGFIPLTENKEYIDQSLYLFFPREFYFFPFFALFFYLLTKKLRAIGRLSDVLFAFTLIGFSFLFALSVSNVDFGAILPVLRHNPLNVFKASYYSLTWFSEGAYVLFFTGNFSMKKGDKGKIVIGYLVATVIALICSVFFYGIFTSIAFRQQFALTEITKYTTVISNTGRFDYFGIVFILFSETFAVILPFFFACKTFERVFNIKKEWLMPLLITVFTLLFLILSNNSVYGLRTFITRKLGFVFIIFGNVIPVVYVWILHVKRRLNANA